MVRDDLTKAEVAVLERQFPGLAARLAGAWEDGRSNGVSDGVRSPHPVLAAVDNLPDEVQAVHPVVGTGCNQRANGVQLVQPRGAAAAPEPYLEPSREPSAAVAQAREEPAALGAAGVPEVAGGGGVGDFFAALGDGWRLTDAQLARLVPSIAAALDAGWEPHQLARFVGANKDGIRSPYAVLAARLSLAELPPPRDKRTTLPA